MQTPQFVLPVHNELVIDLFAGGASTGIEQAIGRPVGIAVNHDPEAINLHSMINSDEIARKRNRWCCERIDQLLAQMPRLDALATIRAEELGKPWERDPRPAPPPLPMGSYYNDRPA